MQRIYITHKTTLTYVAEELASQSQETEPEN
jgi:hypothetical protein